MGNHHEPFMALGAIHWDDVPTDRAHRLKPFLDDIFADAQTVIDSIPLPTHPTAATGRGRSETDSALLDTVRRIPVQSLSAASLDAVQQLHKEWRELKICAKDNPMGITVHKLPAKDGKGTWFARRSIHEGLDYDTWRTGFKAEFPETMKAKSGPGSGIIRGIGADRRVESKPVEGVGHLDVFQLSAQFPGPTAPRDFVTLLLSSDSSLQNTGHAGLRQYMIVSKPCIHPQCPSQHGIVRGSYESVEVVREVPIGRTSAARKRSSSPTEDLGADERRRSAIEPGQSQSTAVEWLMVTRSDPGGSVPRFMVEKGTPPGIVGDAGKFVDWITSSFRDGVASEDDIDHCAPAVNGAMGQDAEAPGNGVHDVDSSTIASGLQQTASPEEMEYDDDDVDGEETEDEEDEEHDLPTLSRALSSVDTFSSALERRATDEQQRLKSRNGSGKGRLLEKELAKLQERRRKLDEKAAQMREALEAKHRDSREKDEARMAKMRERHSRELAKHEAKHRRELERLERKREAEELKAEARRRKTADREEKLTLAMEMEQARAERDVALKQVDILKSQVRELEAQKSMLARGQNGCP